jgi:leucyl aminopeptidase
MHDVLKHMTSYYNRYYGGSSGEKSAEWLHDHIAKVGVPDFGTEEDKMLTEPGDRSSTTPRLAPTSRLNILPTPFLSRPSSRALNPRSAFLINP